LILCAAKQQSYVFKPSQYKNTTRHVVLHAATRRSHGVLQDVLNFASPTISVSTAAFMRPFPNPYHHGLGISAGKPLFHHLNFMVSEIETSAAD